MKRILSWSGAGVAGFLWLLSSAAVSVAAENAMGSTGLVVTHFVKPAAIDLKILVPPAAGSLAAEADLETVLQVQASRTPEQVAWAKLVDKDDVFNHAGILGLWFVSRNLPITTAFFKDIGDDMRAFDGAAKLPFLRPRPPTVDPAVKPCVAMPTSTSFPSGSAMQSYVWAELLSELVPAKRTELVARAHLAAWGRVLGGVHFPTDIAGGKKLAEAYLKECRKSAAFRDALDTCRREIAVAKK